MQFQKKEKRQTTVRFDSHHVRLRTGEVQRKTGSYMAKDENKESEIRGDEQEIVDQRLPVWRPQDADREYYRYETKKRIQHYTVPPQTIFRPAKPTPTIRDAEHQQIFATMVQK